LSGPAPDLYFRQQTFTLGALSRQLTGATHGFGFLAGFALGGLLKVIPPLHFAEKALTLHLFFERFQRLVDVVIADNDLNYLKLSIDFQAGAGLNCL